MDDRRVDLIALMIALWRSARRETGRVTEKWNSLRGARNRLGKNIAPRRDDILDLPLAGSAIIAESFDERGLDVDRGVKSNLPRPAPQKPGASTTAVAGAAARATSLAKLPETPSMRHAAAHITHCAPGTPGADTVCRLVCTVDAALTWFFRIAAAVILIALLASQAQAHGGHDEAGMAPPAQAAVTAATLEVCSADDGALPFDTSHAAKCAGHCCGGGLCCPSTAPAASGQAAALCSITARAAEPLSPATDLRPDSLRRPPKHDA